jgi:anti-sigma regulatory factor (Ser/Thr protein kinase)
LTALRRLLAGWASGQGLEVDTVHAIALSGYEALANVVEHAYGDQDGGAVELDAARVDRVVTVTVADHGQWRSARSSGDRGRGLVLIRGLGSRSEVAGSEAGTTVTMTWLLETR